MFRFRVQWQRQREVIFKCQFDYEMLPRDVHNCAFVAFINNEAQDRAQLKKTSSLTTDSILFKNEIGKFIEQSHLELKGKRPNS